MKNPYIIDTPQSQFDAMSLAKAYESGTNQGFRQMQREEVERKILKKQSQEEAVQALLPNAIQSGDFAAIIEADPSKGKEYLSMQDGIQKMRKGKTLDIFQAAHKAHIKGNREMAVNLIKKHGASLKRIDPTFDEAQLDAASDDDLEDMLEMGVRMSGGNIASQALAEEQVNTQKAMTAKYTADAAQKSGKSTAKINTKTGLYEGKLNDKKQTYNDKAKEKFINQQKSVQGRIDNLNSTIGKLDALKDHDGKAGFLESWLSRNPLTNEPYTIVNEGSVENAFFRDHNQIIQILAHEKMKNLFTESGLDPKVSAIEAQQIKEMAESLSPTLSVEQYDDKLKLIKKRIQATIDKNIRNQKKQPQAYWATNHGVPEYLKKPEKEVLTRENTGNTKARKLQKNSLQFL